MNTIQMNTFEYRWNRTFKDYKTSRDVLEYLLSLDEVLFHSHQVVHNLRNALEKCGWTICSNILS